jgi:hypothetical protein
MAFAKNNSSVSKNKNQFVVQVVSRKTGKQAGFFNMSDVMAREAFGVRTVADVTFAQALAVIPNAFGNELFEYLVTNPEVELVTRDITSF